ncbi:holin [Saccharopolyspora mangrovi]|uniref:Holin n=1 Tax=Saccharopolyspora mangrovi TaxID=3082379 RepID=A0ABU6A7J6_9PSEU|nr:holin [Saccharopolyspora sp. S2-29]MEB3367428.1 holin [Saccharopolyspora sp. S2-29]
MITKALVRPLAERAVATGLVVFVGAAGGDALYLLNLDWWQTGASVLGAAVLSAAQGLIAATGVVGDKGSPSLVKE